MRVILFVVTVLIAVSLIFTLKSGLLAKTYTNCFSDFSKDGHIGIDEILYVIEHWGEVCSASTSSQYLETTPPNDNLNISSDILTLLPPEKGWDYKGKRKLLDILEEIDYLQPSYIPPSFSKSHDYPTDYGSIVTTYKPMSNESNYASLTFTQSTEENRLIKSQDKITEEARKKHQNDTSNRLKIETAESNSNYIYMETPAYALDPYFDPSFSGSEDERKYSQNSDKYLHVFRENYSLVFKLGFGYDIATEDAKAMLVQMADSLSPGIIPPDVALTQQDELLLKNETARQNTASIAFTFEKYQFEFGRMPWEINPDCNGGIVPSRVKVSDAKFRPCLEMIWPLLSDPDSIDENLFDEMYFWGKSYEIFHNPPNGHEEITIVHKKDTDEPRICYKSFILSDYVNSFLKRNPRRFIDDYPMFSHEGKVDVECKDNPIERGCYHCTD